METEQQELLEAEELQLGLGERWTKKLANVFPAFKHINYRLFFIGQLISLIGTWLHNVALGWYVLGLTGSAFWVSVVNAIDFFPILVFSLIAGIIADRFDKRRGAILSQSFALIIALFFTLVIHFGIGTLPLVLVLTFLLGTAFAFDFPIRQSFMIEIVGKNDLASAIALNAAIFNSARVIGPTIAGIIIALFNTQMAFLLNAISFLAVIIAIFKMEVKNLPARASFAHPISQMKEGIVFSFTHPTIRLLLFLTAFNSIIPWAYNSIMPAVAKQVFHTDSVGFGILLSAAGLGALIAAIFVSAFSHRIDAVKAIGITNTVGAFDLLLLSFTDSFLIALLFLCILGFSLITQVSIINTTIQKAAPDYIRGRVMSVYAVMFLGMFPLGSLLIGQTTNIFTIEETIRLFGIVAVCGTMWYWIFLQKRLFNLQAGV